MVSDCIQQIHRMCEAFIEGYDKVTETRATARQMTSWFDSVVRSKQENQTVPAAPVFQAITMRSGMAAHKSTEKIINFMLTDLELGNLEKLELRMIFFIKTNASENDWRFTRRQSVNL